MRNTVPTLETHLNTVRVAAKARNQHHTVRNMLSGADMSDPLSRIVFASVMNL